MLLIADAGSTKTQWKTESIHLIETMGFNPFFHSTAFILSEIAKSEGLQAIKSQVTELYFYGAACSSDDRKAVIENALSQFFPNAKIYIGHDLEAAAYATHTGTPNIACIIGTGSNSCLYDGKNLTEVVPSLGYILGDEGSGSYFGKQLLIDLLYHKSPAATNELLTQKYGLTKEIIFDNIYKKPNANVYLASFAKVLSETTDKAYVTTLVKKGFTDFIEKHVCCYPNYKGYEVSFVGSLAFHFQHIIIEVLAEKNAKQGVFLKSPIEPLFAWHMNKL